MQAMEPILIDSARSLETFQQRPARFEAAMHQICTLLLTYEGRETLDHPAGRPVPKERLAFRTHQNISVSCAHIEKILRDQFAAMPALVKDALKRSRGNAGQNTKSSLSPALLGVLQTVVDRAVAKDL